MAVRRRSHHAAFAATLTLAQVGDALRRITIIERATAATVTDWIGRHLRRIGFPDDSLNDTVNRLKATVGTHRNGSDDLASALFAQVLRDSPASVRPIGYFPRGDEAAWLDRLKTEYAVLLSGVTRSGKSVAARWIAAECETSGFRIAEFGNIEAAERYLLDTAEGGRIAVVDDPLGGAHAVADPDRELQRLETLLPRLKPSRRLIVAQGRERLLKTTVAVDSGSQPSRSWLIDLAIVRPLLADLGSNSPTGPDCRSRCGPAWPTPCALVRCGSSREASTISPISRRRRMARCRWPKPSAPPRSTRSACRARSPRRPRRLAFFRRSPWRRNRGRRRPGQNSHSCAAKAGIPCRARPTSTALCSWWAGRPAPRHHCRHMIRRRSSRPRRPTIWTGSSAVISFRPILPIARLTHPFYRAAAQALFRNPAPAAAKAMLTMHERALFARELPTARAAARSLDWLLDHAGTRPAVADALFHRAQDGLESLFPAVRDLCFEFLLRHAARSGPALGEGLVQAARAVASVDLESLEWVNGQEMLPRTSSATMPGTQPVGPNITVAAIWQSGQPAGPR